MEKVHNKTADCKLVRGTWTGTWRSLVVSALLGKESKKLGTYLLMLSCSVSETPGSVACLVPLATGVPRQE